MGVQEDELARQRLVQGLRVLQQIGMSLFIDLDDHDQVTAEVETMFAQGPDDMEEISDEDLDGFVLLDAASNVVTFSVDGDFEPGEYAGVIEQCVRIAGDKFPATDITEERLERSHRVTWTVGEQSFEASGHGWTDTHLINQGVSGSAKFYQGSWEMCGYLVYLTPEQAQMAQELRGWGLYDSLYRDVNAES